MLLCGGYVILGFAGLALDNLWHTQFGLNETAWSFPHAMIGWGLLVLSLAFYACWHALQPQKPWRWWTYLLFVYPIVTLSIGFVGPMSESRLITEASMAQPIFAMQESVVHRLRIMLTADLSRTNPHVIPLATVWAAMVVAFVRRIDHRIWLFVVVVLLWQGSMPNSDVRAAQYLNNFSVVPLAPALYAGFPLWTMGLAVLLLKPLRVPMRLIYGIAGFAYAAVWLGYVTTPDYGLGWVLLAGPLAIIGGAIGTYAAARLEKLDTWRSILPLLAAAVLVPLVTGMVDLYFRTTIP